MPMSEVLLWLADHQPALEVEVEKDWFWVVTDLAPLHKKCECAPCLEHKAVRDSIKGIGFRFAFGPHPLASGKTSRWSHSCNHPTHHFKRKGKLGEDTTDKPGDNVSDEALLAMLS